MGLHARWSKSSKKVDSQVSGFAPLADDGDVELDDDGATDYSKVGPATSASN